MSFSIGGRTYNATFVGDCSIDFNDPIPGSSLSVPIEGELDTLTRSYKVRLDEKAQVERQLGRLRGKNKDFEYQGMTLYSWTNTEDGPSAVFTVTFKGCYDGKLPNPKITGGFSNGTVTATAFNDFGQKKIDYLAPTTTWQYVTRGIPKGPKYTGIQLNNAEVLFINGNGASGNIEVVPDQSTQTGGQSYSPSPGIFAVRKRIRTTAFNFEQIGGYCQCSETSTTIVEPFEWLASF